MSEILQTLIKTAYETLKTEETRIQNEIKELQDACPHTRAIGTPNSSTGGWDKDSYWIDYKCPDCGKFWVVNQ